jgi:LysM repeat protein
VGCSWVDSILWRPPPDPVPVSGRPPIAAGNAASGRAVHVVHFGDTLWDISRSHGVAVEELAQANGIADADRIEVGQRLVIPASSSLPLSNLASGSARDATPPPPVPHTAPPRRGSTPTLPSVAARAEPAPAATTASPARREASLKRARGELDGHLRTAEDLVRTARFQEAIAETDRARAALGRLEEGGATDAREQRVRLELLSGTACLAIGRDDAATRSFERALAADPDLTLDPARFSPKIVRRVEEIRSRVNTSARARPEQVAGRDTAP